jgi:hypothetical protein
MAATPATIGDEYEVPVTEAVAMLGPGASAVVTMPTPGAASVIHGPWFENHANCPCASVAVTARTPGIAAGKLGTPAAWLPEAATTTTSWAKA